MPAELWVLPWLLCWASQVSRSLELWGQATAHSKGSESDADPEREKQPSGARTGVKLLSVSCRRLMTLNTCASMKLEVHFQRKQVHPWC